MSRGQLCSTSIARPHPVDSTVINQGMNAALATLCILLPLMLVTSIVLYRKHKVDRHSRQIALLERLWCMNVKPKDKERG